MTESTRLFWDRLIGGLLGLLIALGVIWVIETEVEQHSQEDFSFSLEFYPELLKTGVVYDTLWADPLSWRDIIPQETRFLLLYDIFVTKMSAEQAAQKVFDVHSGEEELSAL